MLKTLIIKILLKILIFLLILPCVSVDSVASILLVYFSILFASCYMQYLTPCLQLY